MSSRDRVNNWLFGGQHEQIILTIDRLERENRFLKGLHMANNDGTILMEGVRLIFRNFAGKESQYNREGDRNFGVLIDDNLAQQLTDDGWNVKYLRNDDADEGETPQAWLPVSVSWKGRAPTVVAIGDKTGQRTNLHEDEVEALDWYDLINVDLIVRPYNWEVNQKTGTKAYLKSIYVTFEEDPLQIKYAQQEAS